jgi:hypothetical protein
MMAGQKRLETCNEYHETLNKLRLIDNTITSIMNDTEEFVKACDDDRLRASVLLSLNLFLAKKDLVSAQQLIDIWYGDFVRGRGGV